VHNKQWNSLEDFSISHEWDSLIAVTKILNSPDIDAIKSMAKVNYLEKLKAASNSSQKEGELLFKLGYELVRSFVPTVLYEDFLQLVGLWSINCFYQTLFLVLSNANHSCDPNATVSFRTPNGILVQAAKSIQANEEITISYVDTTMERPHRMETLRVNYGFICNCEKCT